MGRVRGVVKVQVIKAKGLKSYDTLTGWGPAQGLRGAAGHAGRAQRRPLTPPSPQPPLSPCGRLNPPRHSFAARHPAPRQVGPPRRGVHHPQLPL
jgi:hypothetical protein